MTSLTTLATAAIFILTYGGVALGRIPGLRLDRAGVALTGAALMMAVGALSPQEAYRAVDLDTIVLLLGMMIVVAHLKLSGFFRLVAGWALTRAHSPSLLLATVVVTAGTLSAFLVNDAVCLVMAPLIIQVTRALRRDPVPYLLALAMAANVGSTATISEPAHIRMTAIIIEVRRPRVSAIRPNSQLPIGRIRKPAAKIPAAFRSCVV